MRVEGGVGHKKICKIYTNISFILDVRNAAPLEFEIKILEMEYESYY